MKKMISLLTIVFCFGLSCSLDKKYPEAMQKAIDCMDIHPDSALFYLSALDSSIKHERKETQMYHALLTTKAKDKLYISHNSDSVMKIVVDYYEQSNDLDKRMEAYLYLGSIYRDMQDATHCLHAYLQAAEAGKNSRQYVVLARIYYQIGLLFGYQDMPDEFLEATKKALFYYMKIDDISGMTYSYRNIARAYDVMHDTDSACSIIRKH